MKKLLYVFPFLVLFAGIVQAATPISVPSAPAAGYGLISTSTGAYISTSTSLVQSSGGVTVTGGHYLFGPGLTIGCTTATGSVPGCLSAANWTTFNSKQDGDSTLTAFAAYNTNGILTQTAADTFTGRTITGTTNQITVTNGSGVSGNPTLSLPSLVVFPGNASSTQFTNTGNTYLSTTGGNVGIGTTTPAEMLTIGTNASTYATVLLQSGSHKAILFANQDDGAIGFGSKSNHDMSLNSNNTARLLIEAAGDVNVRSNSLVFNTGGTSGSEYKFYQSSDDYITVQRSGGTDPEYSLFTLLAPTANPFESTFATVLDLGGGNSSFTDWYSERYATDRTTGLAIGKRGTGELLPFTLRFWDASAGNLATQGKYAITANPSTAVGIGASTSTLSASSAAFLVASTTAPAVFNGNVGIGTTSPYAKLSISSANASTQIPLFIIASSSAAVSTSTYFTVGATGNVGIASTTPTFPLSIVGQSYTSATSTVGGLNVLAPTTGTSTIYMYSKTAGFGGAIIMEDEGGTACTSVTTKAGVVRAAVVTCPAEL